MYNATSMLSLPEHLISHPAWWMSVAMFGWLLTGYWYWYCTENLIIIHGFITFSNKIPHLRTPSTVAMIRLAGDTRVFRPLSFRVHPCDSKQQTVFRLRTLDLLIRVSFFGPLHSARVFLSNFPCFLWKFTLIDDRIGLLRISLQHTCSCISEPKIELIKYYYFLSWCNKYVVDVSGYPAIPMIPRHGSRNTKPP